MKMKTTGKFLDERDDFKNYLEQINGDGMFLKVQLILSAIVFMIAVVFLLFSS